jgi:hypothetical protein
MLTLGLVLTFATSWAAYQGVVWNLAVGAPDQIAGLLTGTTGSATDGFANKIDIVFARLVEASGDADAPTSTYSPLGLLWLGATLLLLGTVGVLVTCKIALAILLALGPVFVVLALFRGTRGLFVGWLKGMVLLALAPLFAVLGGSMILELAVPVLTALAPAVPGEINPQAAMAFFVLGAVHVALMVIILSVANTMVSGWTVFGLAGSAGNDSEARPGAPAPRFPPHRRQRPHLQHRRVPRHRRRRAKSGSRALRSRPTTPAAGMLPASTGSRSPRPAAPRPQARRRARRRYRARAASAAASARRPPVQWRSSNDPRFPRRRATCSHRARCAGSCRGRPPRRAGLRSGRGRPRRRQGWRAGDDPLRRRRAHRKRRHRRFAEVAGDPQQAGQPLFVKPLTERAATNMTVVTDRHTYFFDLVASPAIRTPLYVLAFTYPDDEADSQQAEGAGAADAPSTIEVAAASDPYAVVDPATLNFAWAHKGRSKAAAAAHL